MTETVMVLETGEVALRLGSAAAVGAALGLNRDLAGKPMGIRTLALVSLGAAIASVSTIQVPTLAEHPDALSRVVQGIVQGVMGGIGFIGAGVVLRDVQARVVKNLTTAAAVWVTAALGLACGLGAWRAAVMGTLIAVVLLVVVQWLERVMQVDDNG
jgi:putative Mg2+ transporter-C (MgtC) family protein